MSNWSTRLRDSKERFLFGGGSAVAIALADELDAKDAEIELLRAALERIAQLPPGYICDARGIARTALEGEK
jgi:hypothetical protein